MFNRRKEDVSDNRSLNSSSSKDEVMNHFTEKKTNDAETSEPYSPDVHYISKESFSLLAKIAHGIINPDDETKHKLIKNRVPPESVSFPLKAYKDKQRKAGIRWRCCQHQWFTQFEFICCDEKEDGLFCLACLLFPVKSTPGGRAKTLITQVYSNWKDATVELKRHAVCSYHKASAEFMRNFVVTRDNKASRKS